MEERKTYKLELTDAQKERLDKLLEFVGNDDYIKLKEIVKNNEDTKEEEFPRFGDTFWYHHLYGVSNAIFRGTHADNELLKIGNCFKTKEEAEFEVERLKVIAEMKKFAEPEDREWNNAYINHWYISYEYSCKKLTANYFGFLKHGDIYFESEEMVHTCIDSVGEDRIKKYYLRVED